VIISAFDMIGELRGISWRLWSPHSNTLGMVWPRSFDFNVRNMHSLPPALALPYDLQKHGFP
jgi:hypothetical protein